MQQMPEAGPYCHHDATSGFWEPRATLTASITVAIMTQVLAAEALTPGGWGHNCLPPSSVAFEDATNFCCHSRRAARLPTERVGGTFRLSARSFPAQQVTLSLSMSQTMFVPLVTDETVSESKDFWAPLHPGGDGLWGRLLSLRQRGKANTPVRHGCGPKDMSTQKWHMRP